MRQDDRGPAAPEPESAEWGRRSVTVDDAVVGSVDVLGPPHVGADGVPEVEVGIGSDAPDVAVVDALRALVGDVEGAGLRVRASVRPDDARGLRILASCGFTDVRGSDEDGGLVMARPARG